MRQANLATILRELHLHGAASRSQLVARTGLTRSSVGELVGELVEVSLVVEERAIPDGSPGRPSPVVRADATNNEVLALEVAVDYIAGAVVGLGGIVHATRRIDRGRDRYGVDTTIADLVALVRHLELGLRRRLEPVAIGVAVAGLVHRAANVVALAPNLGWRDVPLGAALAEALPFDAPVLVANESDLATVAETLRGAAQGVDDVLLVSGEVGVGGGLVSGGRPIIGAAGFAGEIGHLTVNPAGRRCRCGSTGCWETEVGEGSLLRRAHRDPDGGRQAVEVVLAAAAAGDRVALAALDAEAHWIAIGLGGLLNVVNPRLVVFGGFFGRVFPFVIDAVRADLARWALDVARDVVIVPASLGLESPLVGAGELAFDALLADPLGASRHRVA